jgi:hypothetical protein
VRRAAGEDIAHYEAVALALSETHEVKMLVKLLWEFYDNLQGLPDDMSPQMFFSITAPTGSGKTQMGFNLRAAKMFDVVHIVLLSATCSQAQSQHTHGTGDVEKHGKRIWDALEADSNEFVNMSAFWLLRYDLRKQSHTMEVLSDIFGLTAAESMSSATSINTTEALRAALYERATLVAEGKALRLPLLIVDDAHNTAHARLLRDISRAVGLATLVMGTTVDLCLLENNTDSMDRRPGGDSSQMWAYFNPTLPAVCLTGTETVSLLEVNQRKQSDEPVPVLGGASPVAQKPTARSEATPSLRAVEQSQSSATPASAPRQIDATERQPHVLQFLSSLNDNTPGRRLNPLIVRYLWDAAHAAGANELTADALLARTAERLYAEKTSLSTLEGLRGQVQFALDDPLRADDRGLVHSHFARFVGSDLVRLNSTGQWTINQLGDQEPFNPMPVFPSVAEDFALPLILGGCCMGSTAGHPAPFVVQRDHRNITLTSAVALKLLRQSQVPPLQWGHSFSPPALHRNGNFLKSVAVLAATCASRAHGVAGLPLSVFLLHFATELLPEVPTQSLRWQSDTQLERWVQDPHQLMPALLCLRQHENWPAGVLAGLGTIRRSLQPEMDGLVMDSAGAAVFTLEGVGTTTLETFTAADECVGGPSCAKTIHVEAFARFSQHDVALGVAVVSPMADIGRVNVDTADTTVLKIAVIGGELSVQSVGCTGPELVAVGEDITRHTAEQLKPRVLFLFECDESAVGRALAAETVNGVLSSK